MYRSGQGGYKRLRLEYVSRIRKFEEALRSDPESEIPKALMKMLNKKLGGIPEEIGQFELEDAWNNSMKPRWKFDYLYMNPLTEDSDLTPAEKLDYEARHNQTIKNLKRIRNSINTVKEEVKSVLTSINENIVFDDVVVYSGSGPSNELFEDALTGSYDINPEEDVTGSTSFYNPMDRYLRDRDNLEFQLQMAKDQNVFMVKRMKLIIKYIKAMGDGISLEYPEDKITDYDFKNIWRQAMVAKSYLWEQWEEYLEQMVVMEKWLVLIDLFEKKHFYYERLDKSRDDFFERKMKKYQFSVEKIHTEDFGVKKRFI